MRRTFVELSSKVVRFTSGEQEMPKLSPDEPSLAERIVLVPSGEMREIWRSESKVCVMKTETVTLPIAPVILVTTIKEFAPAPLLSGMGTGPALSKRTGGLRIPVLKRNVLVFVASSD